VDFYSVDRVKLFEVELTKLFLSNNRASSQKMMEAKSMLLSETLLGLPTNQIEAFFRYIRDNEEGIPSDGKLLSIYRATVSRFIPQDTHRIEAPKEYLTHAERESIKDYAFKYPGFRNLFNELLQDDDKYPSKDWMGRFWREMPNAYNFNIDPNYKTRSK